MVTIKEENITIILMKKWLDNIDILLYSTRSERNSVVSERFI